jgi:hypothetical protein
MIIAVCCQILGKVMSDLFLLPFHVGFMLFIVSKTSQGLANFFAAK